eukprot:141102-Pyramimonas_sp.AAC.1
MQSRLGGQWCQDVHSVPGLARMIVQGRHGVKHDCSAVLWWCASQSRENIGSPLTVGSNLSGVGAVVVGVSRQQLGQWMSSCRSRGMGLVKIAPIVAAYVCKRSMVRPRATSRRSASGAATRARIVSHCAASVTRPLPRVWGPRKRRVLLWKTITVWMDGSLSRRVRCARGLPSSHAGSTNQWYVEADAYAAHTAHSTVLHMMVFLKGGFSTPGRSHASGALKRSNDPPKTLSP